MCNINEGKLGVDKFAHTHTHTHTHTHERRELLSSECNFNSRSNKGGGRYFTSIGCGDAVNRVLSSISKPFKVAGGGYKPYLVALLFKQEGRLQSKANGYGRNSILFKNGGDWLRSVSHLLMKRGVINACN